MNYRLLSVRGCVFLTTIALSLPLHAVIVACTIFKGLPNDNSCTELHDYHKSQDPRDLEQLKFAISSLKDRIKITKRPLYILTESCPQWIRAVNGDSLMHSLKESLETISSDELMPQLVKIEEIEVRKLLHVVTSILHAREKEAREKRGYDEDYHLFWDRPNTQDEWKYGAISFNDLHNDFRAQKERAAHTLEAILKFCEKEGRSDLLWYYKQSIKKAEQDFALYEAFLKKVGIEDLALKIYKTTYNWKKAQRKKMSRLLLNWYNPFFDFNAFARILTIHKQNSSVDSILIAGNRHCVQVKDELWCYFLRLRKENIKMKESPPASETHYLSPDLIYKLFQKEILLYKLPVAYLEDATLNEVAVIQDESLEFPEKIKAL